MKRFQFLVLYILFLAACRPGEDVKDAAGKLSFDPFPLEVPEQHALMTKWEQKDVLQSVLIDDFEQEGNWEVTGIGQMSYTEDRSRDGRRSLRFRTSLRDEEHYRKNRSEWDSFNGTQGGSTLVRLNFEEPQDWSGYNRISFWVYVHPTTMPTYCIFLRMTCEDVVHTATDYNGVSHFVQDLKPGEWNHVMFEIPHLKRDKVSSFAIYQMLRGHNPEEEGIVTYDIDQLEIQEVVTDMFEGWEVEKNKFAYSHIGYLPDKTKTALAGMDAGDKFQLLDDRDREIFSGQVTVISNSQGTFRLLDFSSFQDQGIFRIKYGDMVSEQFPIHDDVYISPLFKTINFFFCQRCGYPVPGVHLECHKDWQGFYGDTKKVINGGWHDAGDLSQGSWRTAMSTLAMIMNLDRLEAQSSFPELTERMREEIAWGLEWLLRTRFGDGYHMSFSVMRIYTDNEIGTIDDVVTPARNIPWENFLAAAVQCRAANVLAGSHPELAEQSRQASLEDWQAAFQSRDVWDLADYREAAWGATSSLLLAEMTGDETYLEHAVSFGNLLLQCQEQEFIEGIPITGYFYTTTDRDEVIHNRHAAFEEAPLIALTSLCKALPEHDRWMDWYAAAVLHGEYFMKRGSRIAAPYDLLPNSVWRKSEVLAEEDESRRRDMLRQFSEGTHLNESYVLRTFPIYYDALFHGNTNIHMSSTWALAEASRLRGDHEGMELAGKQFQWLFGGNPFSQSLMYGEGHDFPPHFAYCLKDLVGALPVGMDCMSGDAPQWSATNTATYKEIWVEPVNRFMGALAVYLSGRAAGTGTSPHASEGGIDLRAELDEAGLGNVIVTVKAGKAVELAIKVYNLEANTQDSSIELTHENDYTQELKMQMTSPGRPFVIVLSDMGDPTRRWEATGAMVEPLF